MTPANLSGVFKGHGEHTITTQRSSVWVLTQRPLYSTDHGATRLSFSSGATSMVY